MKFRKFNNGCGFQLGGVNGESFMVNIRYFSGKGFRLTVSLNTDRLIKLFGFNQRIIGV